MKTIKDFTHKLSNFQDTVMAFLYRHCDAKTSVGFKWGDVTLVVQPPQNLSAHAQMEWATLEIEASHLHRDYLAYLTKCPLLCTDFYALNLGSTSTTSTVSLATMGDIVWHDKRSEGVSLEWLLEGLTTFGHPRTEMRVANTAYYANSVEDARLLHLFLTKPFSLMEKETPDTTPKFVQVQVDPHLLHEKRKTLLQALPEHGTLFSNRG